MTDEEVAKEAVDELISVVDVGGGDHSVYLGKSINQTLRRYSSAVREAYEMKAELIPSYLAAIAKARRQYPAPSPVNEERLARITELNCHPNYRDLQWQHHDAARAIDDLLTHVAHQNALIAFLTSEGQDEEAMKKLKEAFGK